MRIHPLRKLVRCIGFCAGLVITALAAQAAIVGPYLLDAKTLHLWHLNEASAPALDAVAGGNNLTGLLNGATLGNSSFSLFGNALNTVDGGQNGIAAGMRDAMLATTATSPLGLVRINYADPTTGAFTYEAIVRIDFDPAQNYAAAPTGNGRNTPFVILSAESAINAARLFQFRIMPIGTGSPAFTTPMLTFENIRLGNAQTSIYAPIPTGADANAIAQGSWYHVAVTYNGLPGTAGNIKFYWTLLDTGRTTANPLTITSTLATLNGLNPVSSSYASLVIGNLGSSAQNGNFVGLVDEVRMSSVARDASEMMFAAAGNPVVVADPANQTVAVGQTATLSVSVSGEYPLSYQWRKGTVPVPGATQNVLTFPSAVAGDQASYDVQITHNASVVTSGAAVLTVRTPRILSWTGAAADGNWETASNWQDTSDNSPASYLPGDHVQFTVVGNGFPAVSLGSTLAPSSITVNADFDYTFAGSGRIVGKAGLLKQGAGTLSMSNTNTFTGTTEIQTGTLALRSGGTPGTGPIVNNGSLVFQRLEAGAFLNDLSGSGTITKRGTVEATMFGNCTYNGTISIETNLFSLFGPNQIVNTADIYDIGGVGGAGAAGWSRLGLSGGATIPATTTYHMSSTSSPDSRASLASVAGDNNWNGNIILAGSGVAAFVPDNAGTILRINGNISDAGLTSPAQLSLRGTGGKGIITGNINVACPVNNLGDWTIASSGNSWLGSVLVQGTLHLGAHDAIPPIRQVQMGQGPNVSTLDLAGFNQTLANLDQNQTTPASGAFSLTVGNSSTTSDSTLTLTAGNGLPLPWPGVIQDSVLGGTRKTAFTLSGGVFTLSAVNTYSGPTTISVGTLKLSGSGDIPNSSVINVLSGSIDASGRSDGTLTINTAQTLKGNGNISIAGSFANNGTVELKANKSGGTVTCDQVLSSAITYGGTLKVVLSGEALAASDIFKLFDASSFTYTSAFTAIEPAVPAVGFAWNTSTLNSDGTLRLTPVLTITSTTVSGTDLTLSGISGPAFNTFSVIASTDVSAPIGSWIPVQTGSFDANGAFTAIIPIDSGMPKRFFRIVTP